MGVISLLTNNMIAEAKPCSVDVDQNKEITNMADNALDPNADLSNMLISKSEPTRYYDYFDRFDSNYSYKLPFYNSQPISTQGPVRCEFTL